MIEEVSWKKVVVNGKEYDHDVVIYWDGRVIKRNKELSKKYKALYGHTPLSAEELESYLEEGVEVVVVGTGIYGALPITEEAEELLEEKGVELVALPSEEAASEFNELVKEGKRAIAIIHTTC